MKYVKKKHALDKGGLDPRRGGFLLRDGWYMSSHRCHILRCKKRISIPDRSGPYIDLMKCHVHHRSRVKGITVFVTPIQVLTGDTPGH